MSKSLKNTLFFKEKHRYEPGNDLGFDKTVAGLTKKRMCGMQPRNGIPARSANVTFRV